MGSKGPNLKYVDVAGMHELFFFVQFIATDSLC
jgi:hypothetical protein